MLLQSLVSPARIRILQLISDRPRSLSELAKKLDVSPQATLKHIHTLEKKGLVASASIPRREGTLRRLYRPAIPINVDISVEKEALHIHILTTEIKKREIRETEGNSGLDAARMIEEEKYLLRRRLRTMQERETRVFREMADISAAERALFLNLRLSEFEIAILRAYLINDDEGFCEALRYFKIDETKARKIVRSIAVKKVSSKAYR